MLDVRDPADIKQVGWAIGGTQVAAYWAPTDPSGQTLYSLDMVGGQLNVYRFARPMSAPAQTRAVALGDAAVARVDWERITGGAKTGFDGHFRRLCRVLLRSSLDITRRASAGLSWWQASSISALGVAERAADTQFPANAAAGRACAEPAKRRTAWAGRRSPRSVLRTRCW